MADDEPAESLPDHAQARKPVGPVVWTPIGRVWLETLTARAEAEDAAEAAKAATAAAADGAQEPGLLETPEIPNLQGPSHSEIDQRAPADSGGRLDAPADAGDRRRS